jgi:hypothetical protein
VTDELKAWPFYGYAPGNYTGRCFKCARSFDGLDKRAISCLECAVISAKQVTRPLTGGVTELIERLQRRRDDAAALGGSSEIYLEEIDELIDLAMSNASRGG